MCELILQKHIVNLTKYIFYTLYEIIDIYIIERNLEYWTNKILNKILACSHKKEFTNTSIIDNLTHNNQNDKVNISLLCILFTCKYIAIIYMEYVFIILNIKMPLKLLKYHNKRNK